MSKHSFYHASGTPSMENNGRRIYVQNENTVEPPQLPFNIEFTLAHIDDDRVRSEFIAAVGRIGFEVGINLTDSQVIAIRESAERQVHANEQRKTRAREGRSKPDSVVYYLRFDGNIVKIGTTGDIESRMAAMYRRPQDLLAIEPGDHRLEKMRHKQFSADLADWEGSREMFHMSPALRSHIEMLNKHQANAA